MIALPQIAHDDLLIFVYQKGETRYSDLIEEFVESGKCARQTMTNYKKDLERLGKLGKKISEETGRPVYFIPEEIRPEIKSLMDKREIKDEIDQMAPETFQKLKKTLDAAFSLLRQRKITDALDEGREGIDLRELDVEKDIEREIKRPKLSDVNLFDINKKLWPQFLQEKHPDIWTLVKDGKPARMPKDILEEFGEYRKKELSAGSAEERSNQKETKKG